MWAECFFACEIFAGKKHGAHTGKRNAHGPEENEHKQRDGRSALEAEPVFAVFVFLSFRAVAFRFPFVRSVGVLCGFVPQWIRVSIQNNCSAVSFSPVLDIKGSRFFLVKKNDGWRVGRLLFRRTIPSSNLVYKNIPLGSCVCAY